MQAGKNSPLSFVSHRQTGPNDHPEDSVFFTKRQIKLGTVLTYFGRLDPGSQWEVIRITTELATTKRDGRIIYRFRDVEVVEKLKDTVYLKRVGNYDEAKESSFANISYSAIWRI